MVAELGVKPYAFIIDKPHRWSSWAAPKKSDGSFDHDTALTGDDLIDYVNDELFPYLKGFKQRATGPDTIEYKIGEIFGEIKNKFQSGYSLRDALDMASARPREILGLPPVKLEQGSPADLIVFDHAPDGGLVIDHTLVGGAVTSSRCK